MSYTAIEMMRQKNSEAYGIDICPKQPDLFGSGKNDLKSAALRFIHERCEDLQFSKDIAREEETSGMLKGTGMMEGQVPYNMQMDIDRLCLERELERFIDSGNAEDAYTVYYCYFHIFHGNYRKAKKMIELLSEFESNGTSLLLDHRDHYSHSVYVFTLGLAIYETNEHFRKAYKAFYHFDTDDGNREQDRAAAHHFLAYWGMAALFHDIGYPFEIPFEQVMSYFEVAGQERGDGTPYFAYSNMDPLINFSDEETAHFKSLYNRNFSTLEELLAHVIASYLGPDYDISESHAYDIVHRKPLAPENFNYDMDHAYFSAVRLYHEMVNTPSGAELLTKSHVDALTAILLHNNLFANSIAFSRSEKRKAPLRMEVFPLTFLLMLCDELQCWDRTSYGRTSRLKTHPLSIESDFSGNAIRLTYVYDREEQDKIDEFFEQYRKWEQNGEKGKAPRLKDYSDMTAKEQRFMRKITALVDLSHAPLTADVVLEEVDRSHKHIYLSTSNFLHLYDFAVALNARYSYQGGEAKISEEQLEDEFCMLSLEYQLSNISQAKNFAKYLNAVNCFYTDRPVDCEMLNAFTKEQVDIIAPMEHERWIYEKLSMGWQSGNHYQTIPAEKLPVIEGCDEKTVRKALREQLRMHELLLDGKPTAAEIFEHYAGLIRTEKEKDYEPFNSMLKLVKRFDGLRIYCLPK